MTTFTTEDRELAEKEPIPFFGYYHLGEPSSQDTSSPVYPVLKNIQVQYRIDERSEDIEN